MKTFRTEGSFQVTCPPSTDLEIVEDISQSQNQSNPDLIQSNLTLVDGDQIKSLEISSQELQFERTVDFTVAYPFKSDVITTLPFNCSNEPSPFVYHRILKQDHCSSAFFLLAIATGTVCDFSSDDT